MNKGSSQKGVISVAKATTKAKIRCFYCGKEYVETNYYNSSSDFFKSLGKAPYCKHCIENFYQRYYKKYHEEGCMNAEQEAVKRVCMALDIYYSANAYNRAMDSAKKQEVSMSPMAAYMRIVQLRQYSKKSYDETITELEAQEQEYILSASSISDGGNESRKIDERTINFFGVGFQDDDYIFLQREYDDWTARHECKTKAQEEVFKDICFNRLQNLKALRAGEDTKDITMAFQKMLDSGKLQPKQNKGDTMADNQTFGTLIDKWENTRPLPEIEEELRDVDKIALYIDVFFKGHLAKMMGLKNGLSNLYSKFMKNYTVEKPEYSSDENSEVLFDAIFGNQSLDSDNDKVVM
jgi:hypothetical protein